MGQGKAPYYKSLQLQFNYNKEPGICKGSGLDSWFVCWSGGQKIKGSLQ
jgi:hypothetical protein